MMRAPPGLARHCPASCPPHSASSPVLLSHCPLASCTTCAQQRAKWAGPFPAGGKQGHPQPPAGCPHGRDGKWPLVSPKTFLDIELGFLVLFSLFFGWMFYQIKFWESTWSSKHLLFQCSSKRMLFSFLMLTHGLLKAWLIPKPERYRPRYKFSVGRVGLRKQD